MSSTPNPGDPAASTQAPVELHREIPFVTLDGGFDEFDPSEAKVFPLHPAEHPVYPDFPAELVMVAWGSRWIRSVVLVGDWTEDIPAPADSTIFALYRKCEEVPDADALRLLVENGIPPRDFLPMMPRPLERPAEIAREPRRVRDEAQGFSAAPPKPPDNWVRVRFGSTIASAFGSDSTSVDDILSAVTPDCILEARRYEGCIDVLPATPARRAQLEAQIKKGEGRRKRGA